MGKKIIGGLIGGLFGGPIGAVIGALMADKVDDKFIEGFMDAVAEAKSRFEQLSPEEKAKLLNQLMAAQQRISQSTQLSNQRYDLRVSELQGMAAEAGIDWRPGSM